MKSVIRQSLGDQVHQTLRESIIRGELKQGERLVELDIARRLGSSQAPVREALARLAEEGLVVSYPHKGSFVSNFTDKDIDEIYSFREIMEPFAIRRAIERLSDSDIEALEQLYEQMVAVDARHDIAAIGAADLAFHSYIYRLADHQFMGQVWELLSTKASRIWWYLHYELYFPSLLEAAHNHRALMDAIREHDAERAISAFLNHLAVAKRQIYQQR